MDKSEVEDGERLITHLITLTRPSSRHDDPGVEVGVEIVETRRVFGRTDCLVRPVAGRGELWVNQEALRRPQE